jgi:hypothetical protein
MKLLLVVLAFAAAVAEPEADPLLLLNRGIYNYPLQTSHLSYRYINSPYNYPQHFIGKREAEAESDPALLLTRGIYNPYVSTLGYNTYNPYVSTLGYRGIYNPLRILGKREAESDPALVYTDGQFHTNVENLQKGIHLNKALSGGSLYNTFTPQYSSYFGYPYGHFIGKRDAEAESDPALLLTRGIYNPYVSSLGYNTYNPYVSTLGYRNIYNPLRILGKREAEADPALVYTDGVFHTNVQNLKEGINTDKVHPFGAVYNTVPLQYTTLQYSHLGYPYTHAIGKREADSQWGLTGYPYNTWGTTYPWGVRSGLVNRWW